MFLFPQEGAAGAGAGQVGQSDLDEGQDDPAEETQDPVPDDDGISNSVLKKNPVFRKIASENAQLKRQIEERDTAEAEAKRQKEIADAKKKEDFETASRLEKEASDQKVKDAETRALSAEVKAALVTAGANVTDAIVKVAMAEYDAEKHADATALAEDMKKNKAYAGFWGKAKGERTPVDPPSGTPVNGGTANWDQAMIDKVRAKETSTDLKERKEARILIGEYRKAHGKYPYPQP